MQREYHDMGEQKGRIGMIMTFLVIFGIVILGRLFYLQVFKHNYYQKIASVQHWAQGDIPAKRGKIYVKDEMAGGLYPLAGNQTLSLVYGAPEEMFELDKEENKIDKKNEVAEKISPLVGIEIEKLKELFDKNHTYVPIKHYLTFEEKERIKSLDLPGIFFSDEDRRYYPEQVLASQLLGYVNTEGEGKYGLEQYFDTELAGTDGQYRAEVDPGKKKIAFGNNILTPAKDGVSLVLTINRDVQAEAEKLLKESVSKFSAENGNMIVMNPDNGEIVAMANYPTYDPNKYKEVTDYKLFRNSSVVDVFEPGSIFKIITMAAGLDTKKVEPDTKYDDTGEVVLNGHKIMNSTKKAWGLVDMTFVIQESLNTGTVFVLNQIGKDVFYDYLKKFGFGIATGIEQPLEGEGRVYSPSELNDHGYATMTFGQSISVTSLQMIRSFAAIANGGKLVKPHLVSEKIYSDGKKETTDNRPTGEVISREAALKETAMMVNQVENGHGKQAKVKGYKIAGKTGTAQVAKPGGGYETGKNIGSFIGFGPADSPRFVVIVRIDSPKGIPWAESSAAPPVGKMLDFLFKYYQIPPTEAQ